MAKMTNKSIVIEGNSISGSINILWVTQILLPLSIIGSINNSWGSTW